jgi:hypothetical protein
VLVLEEVRPSADAKFLNAPVVLDQAVLAVVRVAAVPIEVTVEPVLTVHPVGKEMPILSKVSR